MIINHVFAMAAMIVSFLAPVTFSSAKQISTIIAMGLQVANFIFCCDLMFVVFEAAGINTTGNEMMSKEFIEYSTWLQIEVVVFVGSMVTFIIFLLLRS